MTSRRAIDTRQRKLVRVFFVLVALPFLTIFPYFAATNNPNENTRTFMTMALVENGTFQLDAIVARQGWTNDMAKVKDAHGVPHMYAVKGPANGYMGVPVYWAFRKIAPLVGIAVPDASSPLDVRVHWLRMTTWVIRLFSVSLPCYLFLIWFERYLRAFSRDPVLRLSAVAAAGIGTNYLGYALMNVSHALFAVAAFLAFGLTERELRTKADPRDRSALAAFAVGLCAGWVTMLEYHGLPLSVVLTVFAIASFFRPKQLAAIAAGGAITIALTMFFQWAQYGNPFTPGHQFVENPQWAAEHKKGVFGIIWPSVESVEGLSLPVGSGFFGMSPYMWLGLALIGFATFPAWRSGRARVVRRKAAIVALLGMGVLWFAACGALEWRAGWTLGPRRLGAAPPFFAYGALLGLESLARRGRVVRAITQGVSVGLATVGVVAVGFVGIVYNTLPEAVLRPFAYFAFPLARGGFVAHHVGEWFGWKSTTFWYVAAAALLLAPLIALAFRTPGDRTSTWAVRLGVAAVTLAVGLFPALTKPSPLEAGEHQPNLAGWVAAWEPAGRDRLSTMRDVAERYGPRRACPWYRLADLERALDLTQAAVADERRARAPRPPDCAPLRF